MKTEYKRVHAAMGGPGKDEIMVFLLDLKERKATKMTAAVTKATLPLVPPRLLHV
jgi:hypothetical protein